MFAVYSLQCVPSVVLTTMPLSLSLSSSVNTVLVSAAGLSYAVVEEVEQLRIPGSHTVSPTAPAPNAAANAAADTAGLTGPNGFTAGSGPGDHKVANPTPPRTLIPTATWHLGASGVAVELLVNVTLPAPGAAVCSAGLRIRATEDGTEQTTVALWSSTRVDLVTTLLGSLFTSLRLDLAVRACFPTALRQSRLLLVRGWPAEARPLLLNSRATPLSCRV